MEIVIYSPNPKIAPITLTVDKKYWHYRPEGDKQVFYNLTDHPDTIAALYNYAYLIMKCRWPEAEPIIKLNAEVSYRYALNVAKARCPDMEDEIKSNARWACWYAADVIKGRWPEAEEAINQNPKYKAVYQRVINPGPANAY